ncbi:MAG: glycosyltransferase family 2 protein [Candidatus Asgardarchaeia archaeon]
MYVTTTATGSGLSLFYDILPASFVLFSMTIFFLFNVYRLYMTYLSEKFFKNRTSSFIIGKDYNGLKDAPLISIWIPVKNEGTLVNKLMKSLLRLRYPRDRIQILVGDDSTDYTYELLKKWESIFQSEGIKFELIHRNYVEKGKNGRASVFNILLKKTVGDYFTILDADFIVPEDYLIYALPYFSDPKVAYIQTNWVYVNEESSWVSQAAKTMYDSYMFCEKTGRLLFGFPIIFNGTSGFFRTDVVRKLGGWDEGVLSEEVEISYRILLRGYKGVYIPEYFTRTELPTNVVSYRNQQFHWAKGTAQVLRKYFSIIWKSENLSFREKVGFLFHLIAYPSNILSFALSFILCVTLLIQGTNSVFLLRMDEVNWILSVLGSFNVMAQLYVFYKGQRIQGVSFKKSAYRTLLVSLITLGITPLIVVAVFSGFFSKKGSFTRTREVREESKNGMKITLSPKSVALILESATIILSSLTIIKLFYIGCLPYLLFYIFLYTLSISIVTIPTVKMKLYIPKMKGIDYEVEYTHDEFYRTFRVMECYKPSYHTYDK